VLGLAIVLAACGPEIPEGATGEEIYPITCARCHGGDLSGIGTTPGIGAGSPASDEPRQYLVDTVTNGRSRMPSFGGTLTSEQIDLVVDYVMEQQGR
jgi:mono/diheme cytochrome c family protein